MKPLHKYKRVLELYEQNITDIHLDYVFTGWEDGAAPWNKPLRVRYKSKEGEKTIYLFVSFHHKY